MLISCFSVKIPSRIKKNFICNDGYYTGLDTLIDINGIYYIPHIRDMYNKSFPTHKIDTFYLNFMFWNDGTIVYNFAGNPNTYQLYFDEILAKIEQKKRNNDFYLGFWGNYRIIGDTIKCQYLWHPYFISLNESWYGWEIYYKIIDKNTLEFLPEMTKSLDPRVNKERQRRNITDTKIGTAFFFPIERIPPPNCLIKKKKWFWCSEEDWKKYINNPKQSKRMKNE